MAANLRQMSQAEADVFDAFIKRAYLNINFDVVPDIISYELEEQYDDISDKLYPSLEDSRVIYQMARSFLNAFDFDLADILLNEDDYHIFRDYMRDVEGGGDGTGSK